jgi:pimeloyl-ACP methyl ester carboxylesterase
MLRLLILSCVVGLGLLRPAFAEEKPAYQKIACDLQGVPAAVQPRLSCATLRVKSPDGSTFQLAVTRRAAAEPQQGSLPILYWPAGPGSDVTRYGMTLEADPVAGHELILLDFRGSGRSQPKFCTGLQQQLVRQMTDSQQDQQWLSDRKQLMQSCLQQMSAGGFTQEDFGSSQAVADAELLREMLNISQWHLYASGNASTVALQYLSTARKSLKSVVLDAIVPPDELWLAGKTVQDQWLRQLQQICQQQTDCQRRYGNLTELFAAALQQVAAKPLLIPAGNRQVLLTADKLRLWTWLAGQQPDSLSLLPFWLHAVRQQQAGLLAPWVRLSQRQLLAAPADSAAWLAAECADRSRYYRGASLDALEQQLWLPAGLCPHFSAPERALESGQSVLQAALQPAQLPQRAYMRTPLLMLTGSLDVGQPDTAVLQQWLGPVSQLVQVQGGLQQIGMQNNCQIKAVRDFFLNPLHFGAPACLTQISAPYLITALQPNAVLTAELDQWRGGQMPWLALTFAGLLVLAVVLGPCWSLLSAVGRWLLGQPVLLHWPALYTNSYLTLVGVCWFGVAWQSWLALQRGSGEFWYGMPVGAEYGRMAVVVLSIGGLWAVHQLAARQCWRLLSAVSAMLAAALLALHLHILP